MLWVQQKVVLEWNHYRTHRKNCRIPPVDPPVAEAAHFQSADLLNQAFFVQYADLVWNNSRHQDIAFGKVLPS